MQLKAYPVAAFDCFAFTSIYFYRCREPANRKPQLVHYLTRVGAPYYRPAPDVRHERYLAVTMTVGAQLLVAIYEPVFTFDVTGATNRTQTVIIVVNIMPE